MQATTTASTTTSLMTALSAILTQAHNQPEAPITAHLIDQAHAAIAAAPPKIGDEWPSQGGIYAGIARGQNGAPDYHLVLLPGDHDDTTWKKATAWAAEAGGELPSRSEQSLLFANLKDQFKADWYWSSEVHASDSDCAWYQLFGHGDQHYCSIFSKLRALAVRRLPIQ